LAEEDNGEQWSLALDDQVCFALYAASRAVTGLYRPVLDTLGLTYPQYLVLLVLWERGQVPVRELGEALSLDYGTLTPLLKRLEAHGLLRRERSAKDERSVLITLTAAGTELRERASAIPPFAAKALGLEPAEYDQLRVLLRRLTSNAEAAAASPAARPVLTVASAEPILPCRRRRTSPRRPLHRAGPARCRCRTCLGRFLRRTAFAQAVMLALSPAVTANDAPLTMRASSEARNATTGATSVGSIQGTPSGLLAASSRRAVSSSWSRSPLGSWPEELIACA
jgi:DNA-binding MarR family transcriptional regulator